MTTEGSLDPQQLPDEPQSRQALAAELKQKALAARQRGELLTAMLHASDALMLYPNEREYLDLVDEIALGTQDPLSLVPVATGAVHVATAAARARIMMMQKDLGGAIELVCEVVDVAPDLDYFDWVRRWLQPQIIESLGWKKLAPSVVRTAVGLLREAPPGAPADHPCLSNIRAAADTLALLRQSFPDKPELYFGEAALRRRLGDPNATLAVANEGVQRFPNEWSALTTMENALGDAGHPDDALGYARRAMQLDPGDFSPLDDAAWGYIKAQRFDQAAQIFDEIIAAKPGFPGERHAALHYCRFRATGSPEERQALLRMRDRQWWNDTAQDLADEIDPPVEFENTLPGPQDPTAYAGHGLVREIKQIIQCCGQGGSVETELESQYLDAPSVPMAFDLSLRSLGAGGKLNIKVAEVQQPDPRADKAQVQFRLWQYQGTTPQRVYGQADPRVQQAIAQIADQVFSREGWDQAARAVAAWGPDWIHGFMAVMTDPPLLPQNSEFDGFIWTYRCQVATAIVLSHLGPWESGPGRAALYSLLYGPGDWTTDAAIIALYFRAKENPALRPEVENMFQWMRGQIPEKGFTSWEAPLAHSWRALGGHSPEVERELDAWIARYHRSYSKKNRVQPPERKYGGLSLRQYAEFSVERDVMIAKQGYSGTLGIMARALAGAPPPGLQELCDRYGVPMYGVGGVVYPYIEEWNEAMNGNPDLHREFIEMTREIQLEKQGVSAEEKAALDNILDGNMDMHERMAQAQQAQRAVAEGNAGDPDPVVFPGQPVARLSDYVGIMKGMQTGDMMGALGRYGLDMMSYGGVAQAWGAKMAADPVLMEKFTRMMNG